MQLCSRQITIKQMQAPFSNKCEIIFTHGFQQNQASFFGNMVEITNSNCYVFEILREKLDCGVYLYMDTPIPKLIN